MADETLNDTLREARDHAWDWFTVHANQRMQTINFFLISVAFLLAAYGALLSQFPLAAVVIATLGAWIAAWFIRLDARTKELIKAGELALNVYEKRLADRCELPEVQILDRVEEPGRGVSTYSTVFLVIEWSVVVAFMVGAVYAAASFIINSLPGRSVVVSPSALYFASPHDKPKALGAWQPGYSQGLTLENGCPGIAATTGADPRWVVSPLAAGRCEIVVHGTRNSASVEVRVQPASIKTAQKNSS